VRWEVYAWAILALVLIAAETVAPGAFLMWLGFAAGVMFLLVLAFPDMPLLAQAVLFTALAFAFVFAYRKWFRDRDRRSDQPTLNRRTSALIGRVVTLEGAIVRGRGRVQIADAYWDVAGPDLPAGAAVRIVGAEGMTLRVEAA
jgi:membrane protein implicated in regulation of membrane protease activity